MLGIQNMVTSNPENQDMTKPHDSDFSNDLSIPPENLWFSDVFRGV